MNLVTEESLRPVSTFPFISSSKHADEGRGGFSLLFLLDVFAGHE